MRKVVFEGNTPEIIRQLPDDARYRSGYEIDRVQRDKEPENWKPFPAIGQGAREIRIQVDGRTGLSISPNLKVRSMFYMCSRKKYRKLASRASKLRSMG